MGHAGLRLPPRAEARTYLEGLGIGHRGGRCPKRWQVAGGGGGGGALEEPPATGALCRRGLDCLSQGWPGPGRRGTLPEHAVGVPEDQLELGLSAQDGERCGS